MRFSIRKPRRLGIQIGRWSLLLAAALTVHAQTCLTAGDMDAATKTALTSSAQSYFSMVARGDAATLRQNAIASVAADFSGIESAIKDNQSNFTGATSQPRSPFLLQAANGAAPEHGEFLCGVFGASGQTANSVVFQIAGLAPGDYGIVIVDVTTAKGPYTVAFVLEKQDTAWKLGGLYIKQAQVGGHDADWYAEQARALKAKGKNESAWLYYLEARELAVPLPFMSTMMTDKLYDEAQTVKPAVLPPMDLAGSGKTFNVTTLFPIAVGSQLDLVVKYQSPSVANSSATFQDNTAVMKALLAKYPELRDIFDGVIARAVEPSGRDYGTMLPMKDVK